MTGSSGRIPGPACLTLKLPIIEIVLAIVFTTLVPEVSRDFEEACMIMGIGKRT
jgi:hypothetical protein|tara:strand:- start:1089 stop:1250 length:162 start_codon:yes stop_codon:yes gene_type:complete